MIIALHAYRPIKQLCRYCHVSSTGFKLLDSETVSFISGIFGGIVFEFQRDLCRVKIGQFQLCIDLTGDFSADAIVGMLTRHNIIRPEELDE